MAKRKVVRPQEPDYAVVGRWLMRIGAVLLVLWLAFLGGRLSASPEAPLPVYLKGSIKCDGNGFMHWENVDFDDPITFRDVVEMFDHFCSRKIRPRV